MPMRVIAKKSCRAMFEPPEKGQRVTLHPNLSARLNQPARITVRSIGRGRPLDAAPIVSPESLPTPQIMGKIAALAHSMWPGVPVIPTMATGFSDDRQTRNGGIPSYDVSGVWMDVDENRAHGRDERVGATAYDESVEFTYRLMKSMGRSK